MVSSTDLNLELLRTVHWDHRSRFRTPC